MAKNVAIISNQGSKTGIGRYAESIDQNITCADLLDFNYPGHLDSEEHSVGYNLPFLEITVNKLTGGKMFEDELPGDYDVYHFSSPASFRWGKDKDNKVVTVHDIFPLTHNYGSINSMQKLYFRLELRAIRKSADKIITVSDYTKQSLVGMGLDAENIKSIPLGVDKDKFRVRDKRSARRKLDLDQDKFYILHVGTEIERKNIETLIESLSSISCSREVRLLRIGSTRDKITRLIEDRNMEEKVIRPGKVPEEDLKYYYNAADVFVFPSLVEGFGLPVLEAMSSGCPVISSNGGSLPEVVGEASIMVEPRDQKTIAEEISTFAENKERLKEYSQKSLNRAEKFSWAKTAEETMEVYSSLV